MKKLIFFLLLVLIMGAISSCQKDPKEAILPEEVEFGQSVIYLNGEVADYLPVFNHDTINYLLNFSFVETKNQGQLVNSLSFAWLPLHEGEYKLITKREPRVNALTSFSQTVSEDLDGYEYKLMDADEGFFNIDYLDTINIGGKRAIQGQVL